VDPAARVSLGRQGLKPTRLGLGGGPLGNMYVALSDDEARATVDAAWDAGVRLFDTAPLYGHGLSEQRLGAALRSRPRDEYVLCTKVGRVLEPGIDPNTIFVDVPPLRPRSDYSADGVKRSIDESLGRLGTDRIDIVHVHDPDDHEAEAVSGAFPTLCTLRDDGVIGAVGAGMNQAAMLARFVRRVDLDCVLLAGRYSLLSRDGEEELLPLCAERGVDVIVGGVFNSGLLADGDTYNYVPAQPEMIKAAAQMRAVCENHRVSVKAAALQFPFTHEAVTAVLVGAKSPDEIAENAALMSSPVPSSLWREL
jgi:D-threo-aldose 1-dehydrogenase